MPLTYLDLDRWFWMLIQVHGMPAAMVGTPALPRYMNQGWELESSSCSYEFSSGCRHENVRRKYRDQNVWRSFLSSVWKISIFFQENVLGYSWEWLIFLFQNTQWFWFSTMTRKSKVNRLYFHIICISCKPDNHSAGMHVVKKNYVSLEGIQTQGRSTNFLLRAMTKSLDVEEKVAMSVIGSQHSSSRLSRKQAWV